MHRIPFPVLSFVDILSRMSPQEDAPAPEKAAPLEKGAAPETPERPRRYWAYVWEESWLWQYCVTHGFLATNFGVPGGEGEREDFEALSAFRAGDGVVSAFAQGWLLAHGTVERELYQDASWENGFSGLYGHRVGVTWKNFRPMRGVLVPAGDGGESIESQGGGQVRFVGGCQKGVTDIGYCGFGDIQGARGADGLGANRGFR